ncbi:MAG: glycosyltransferase family 2 protein [Acetobacteraceae bacterium]|nr:glycosyltransferase family 2 protein [Acetobacteraceae bacterium]
MSYSQQLPGSDLVLARSAGRPAAAGEALLRRGLLLAYAAQGRWPWLGTQLRRSVLLVWWTCTLQIHTHLRQWLRARCRPAKTPAANDPLLLDAPAAHSISVPCAPRPRVSVIVPTFGKVEFTLRCLASIAAHPPVAAIEVIVVDDAFPGPETACLRNVAGIRLLRNQANLGYLRACNNAALQASGEYLLFLNNDTQVQPGWLDSMLEIFATHGAVGAVGSQLLSPDGRLQEAGGIIWRDGSGWNYGRGDDPTRPQYNYVREVDYCSGASMMVPRMLFQRISGFDERYAPAYYEDTDLCFRLRALGLKTMYQPRSRVVHFDGVSHGRDPSAGVKAFQEENRKTFLRIWPHILARENFENGIQVMRARDRAARRSMALVIDHKMPEADRDAGSRAILCVIRALQADGMVVKFWPANLQYVPKYTEALQDMGVEVFYGPDQAPLAAWLREHGSTLDLVVLSRPDVAEHSLDAVQASSSARIVYYGHDLHHRRMAMQAKVTGDLPLLLEAQRMEQRERSIWRRVDRVLYLSEEEAAEVRAVVP